MVSEMAIDIIIVADHVYICAIFSDPRMKQRQKRAAIFSASGPPLHATEKTLRKHGHHASRITRSRKLSSSYLPNSFLGIAVIALPILNDLLCSNSSLACSYPSERPSVLAFPANLDADSRPTTLAKTVWRYRSSDRASRIFKALRFPSSPQYSQIISSSRKPCVDNREKGFPLPFLQATRLGRHE